MKKILAILGDLLPHFSLALSIVLMTCFILDRYNRAMNFINNNITKWMICVLCAMTMILAVLYIYERRRRGKKKKPVQGNAQPTAKKPNMQTPSMRKPK